MSREDIRREIRYKERLAREIEREFGELAEWNRSVLRGRGPEPFRRFGRWTPGRRSDEG